MAQVEGPSGNGAQFCTSGDYNYGLLISIESRSGLWMDAIDLVYDVGRGKHGFVHCGGSGGPPNRWLSNPKNTLAR